MIYYIFSYTLKFYIYLLSIETSNNYNGTSIATTTTAPFVRKEPEDEYSLPGQYIYIMKIKMKYIYLYYILYISARQVYTK